MIQYIIAAGVGALLGFKSKKSKKSYAHGGEVGVGDEVEVILNGGGVKDKYVFKYVIFDEYGDEVDDGVEEGFGKTEQEAENNLLTRLEEGLGEGEEVEIERKFAKGGSTSTKKEKDEVILDILFRDFPDTSNQIMDYIDEKRKEEAEPAEWGDEEEEPAELSSEEQDEMILDVLRGGYPKIYDKITDYIDDLAS